MHLYGLEIGELCQRISGKLALEASDILSKDIKLTYLKRIDKIFGKGLSYYLNPSAPLQSKESSVFYRKATFNGALNLRDHQLVNDFEQKAHLISAYSKLADFALERKIGIYSIADDPKLIAAEMSQLLKPRFSKDLKKHLQNLILVLSNHGILVFEFVDHPNLIEKSSVDGFFLSPNTIVIKRQKYFRRELFTLAHELGHYLLNSEEIESVDDYLSKKWGSNQIEKWCNDFAFYFLGGKAVEILDDLDAASPSNDYHHDTINHISASTNLSRFAILTRLLFMGKVNQRQYGLVKKDLNEQIAENDLKKKIELEKKGGIPRGAKAINSPLTTSVMQIAYYSGVVEAHDVGKMLNINPEKLKRLLE